MCFSQLECIDISHYKEHHFKNYLLGFEICSVIINNKEIAYNASRLHMQLCLVRNAGQLKANTYLINMLFFLLREISLSEIV